MADNRRYRQPIIAPQRVRREDSAQPPPIACYPEFQREYSDSDKTETFVLLRVTLHYPQQPTTRHTAGTPPRSEALARVRATTIVNKKLVQIERPSRP